MRFFDEKNEKLLFFWKCWVSGLQNEQNIACPKNYLTTVFVAQNTDPLIKNGVIDPKQAVSESRVGCSVQSDTVDTYKSVHYKSLRFFGDFYRPINRYDAFGSIFVSRCDFLGDLNKKIINSYVFLDELRNDL